MKTLISSEKTRKLINRGGWGGVRGRSGVLIRAGARDWNLFRKEYILIWYDQRNRKKVYMRKKFEKSSSLKEITMSIVTRNGKIVWKHGPNC